MSGQKPDPERKPRAPRRRADPATHPRPSAPAQPTRRRRNGPKQVTAPPLDDADAWAVEIAATLPPMTPAEAAHVGHLAAILDARGAARTDAA
jgi:hypothetical protein